MGTSWRLFLALPVPAPAAADVAARCAPYRRAFPAVRWLPADGLHLTLLFLGAVAEDRVAEVRGTPRAIAAGHRAFEVETGPGGGRVRRDDGVAWLGLTVGGSHVATLVAAATAACPPAITVSGEDARPSPAAHLTVARRATASLVEALRLAALGPLQAGWTADRVVLYRSHPGAGGSRYEPLEEALLPV